MSNASASDVRQFFAQHSDLIPSGDKTVVPGSRGRLSAEAQRVFTEHTSLTYLKGSSKPKSVEVTYVKPNAKGAKRTYRKALPVSEVRRLAGAPERGRLSSAHLAKAGEEYARSL